MLINAYILLLKLLQSTLQVSYPMSMADKGEELPGTFYASTPKTCVGRALLKEGAPMSDGNNNCSPYRYGVIRHDSQANLISHEADLIDD